MIGGDAAEKIGIGPERLEEVHAFKPQRVAALIDHRRVLGRGTIAQPAERRLQRGGADLGGAAAAAHRFAFGHGRRAMFLHEGPVDPVFPAPDPAAFGGEGAAGGDGAVVASGEQAQKTLLRREGAQGLAPDGAA